MSKLDKVLILLIIVNLFASIFIIFGKEKVEQEKVFEIGNIDEFYNVYKFGPSPEKYREFVQELVENKFNEIYENTKNLSDSNLKKYYEENSTTSSDMVAISNMQSSYGISDYNTFNKLVNQIREIKDKKAKYKKCRIVKDSCDINSGYTKTEIVLEYSKSIKITLNIEMANMIQYDTQIFKMSVKEEI